MAATTATGPVTQAVTWGQTFQSKHEGYIKFLGDNSFACVKKLSLNEGDGLLMKVAKVAASVLALVLAPVAMVVSAFKWAATLCCKKADDANKSTADPVADAKKALDAADAAVVVANKAVADAEAAAQAAVDAQKVADDALAAKAGDAELTAAAAKAKEATDAANAAVVAKKEEATKATDAATAAKTKHEDAVKAAADAKKAAEEAAKAADSETKKA